MDKDREELFRRCDRWVDKIDCLERDIESNKQMISRLEQWINDCQAGMYINCVYCGHRYGPDDGDHLRTMRQALEDHIATCPKHPLSKALAENQKLRDERDDLEEKIERICATNGL